jgi:hypothetical protein
MTVLTREELALLVMRNTSERTRQRHARWRDLPPRPLKDIAERCIERNATLARRAEAARKAGLLP